MTAWCKVTVSKMEPEQQPDHELPKAPKPPKAPKAKKGRHGVKQAEEAALPRKVSKAPEAYEDTSLEYSELPGEPDQPEAYWEEVHENVGDNVSDGYPSDEEPAAMSVGSAPEEEADSFLLRRCTSPKPKPTFVGQPVQAEAEVF